MMQKEEESLEDFMERLLYNVQRAGQTDMGRDVLKSSYYVESEKVS